MSMERRMLYHSDEYVELFFYFFFYLEVIENNRIAIVTFEEWTLVSLL